MKTITEQGVRRIFDHLSVSEIRGEVANYIPELANISTKKFGVSIVQPGQETINVGDFDAPFSIQSISKVFTLSIALGRYGDKFWDMVSKEPSQQSFNSISELESHNGKPSNPFVNAGAIVTTDSLLVGRSPKETLAELITFIREISSSNDIYIDKEVAKSEESCADKNRAIAYFLRSTGYLRHECDLTLGTYFHQCAVAMNCRQLGQAGRFLAGFPGKNNIISRKHVHNINALMMTCGQYNGSGDFAFRIGLPSKSGVGGGILAVVPNGASIAVWSPGLNEYGNSLIGTQFLQMLSQEFELSLFMV